MSKPIPVPEQRGFMNLSLSAQALFFHLWVRSREMHSGRYGINAHAASDVKEHIGATDGDVRALMKNGFITAEGGVIYPASEVEWMPGPIEEIGGVDTVRFIFPGSRMEYWRESLERYRRELAEQEEERRSNRGRRY